MMPERMVQAMEEIGKLMDVNPSAFTDHQLNAIDAYSRTLGKRARSMLKGRHPKIEGGIPLEW